MKNPNGVFAIAINRFIIRFRKVKRSCTLILPMKGMELRGAERGNETGGGGFRMRPRGANGGKTLNKKGEGMGIKLNSIA